MIRLRIEPEPPPDEAAAIEAALKALVDRRAGAAATRLSYRDVHTVPADELDARINSRDYVLHSYVVGGIYSAARARINSRDYSWSDVARFEALTQSV